MSPTPNTTFFRELAKCGHFWQTRARSLSSARAATLASGVRVDRGGGVDSEGMGRG